LILKGLLHEIFSALPAISEESEAQSVNSRDDRQRIKERSKERSKERDSATYSSSSKIIINNRSITWQA
jgi:hypothetical protein